MLHAARGRQFTCSFGLGTEFCLGLNLLRPYLTPACVRQGGLWEISVTSAQCCKIPLKNKNLKKQKEYARVTVVVRKANDVGHSLSSCFLFVTQFLVLKRSLKGLFDASEQLPIWKPRDQRGKCSSPQKWPPYLHRRLITSQYGLKILGGWKCRGRWSPRWREEETSCVDPTVSTMTLGTRAPVHSFPPHKVSNAAFWQDLSLHFLLEQGQSSWVTVLTVNLWDGGMEGTAASWAPAIC